MTDDALDALRASLARVKDQQEASMTDAERVRKQYADWVDTVATGAFEKLEEVLLADGADVGFPAASLNPPIILINVEYEGLPPFVYSLSLHPETGTERAFVMKTVTVPDREFPDESDKETTVETQPFFDEHNDGCYNHAPQITEANIIRDFTDELTKHRLRKWSA